MKFRGVVLTTLLAMLVVATLAVTASTVRPGELTVATPV